MGKINPDQTHKVCRTCNNNKPVTEYYRGTVYRDGYTGQCKTCQGSRDKVQIDPETYKKTCSSCNEVKPANEFGKNARYRDGYYGQCKKCDYRNKEEWRTDNRDRVNRNERERKKVSPVAKDKQKRDKAKERAKKSEDHSYRLWCYARSRYNKYGVPFDIEPEDIVVPEFCPVLGVKLEKGEGTVQHCSPSLDRIIPALGYVKGNIVVVSHRANTMKNDATVAQLGMLYEFYKNLTNKLAA